MRIRLRTADGCLRVVMVDWQRPKPFFTTMLRYPLRAAYHSELGDIPSTMPIKTTQRRYEFYNQVGPEFYEYREVLDAN